LRTVALKSSEPSSFTISLGAELRECEGLGSGLVGALVDKRLGDAPVIFVNTSETVFWQRFNVACMLGHIMEREHRGLGDRYSYSIPN
jgi:hypothetical protein